MKHLKDFIKAGAVVTLTTFGISHSAFATQTTISTATAAEVVLNPATNDQLSVTPAGSITIPAAANTPAVLISPANAGGSVNIINNGTLDTSAEVTTNNPAITIQSAAFNNNNITINNTNTIKTTPAGPFAIDFSNAQAGTGGSVTINQSAGTITGGIAFPNFANVIPTLNVSGGAITGSVNSAVTGQNNGSINVNGNYAIPAGQSIFNIGAVNVTSGTLTTTGAISTAGNMTISGGATHTVSGSVDINNNVGGNNLITNNGLLNVTGSVTIDQHNIAAAAVRNLINNNTITVTGGTIGAPIVGNNTLGSILSMNNFTPTNTIANVGVVNVTGGTVTFGTANPPPGQISTVPTGFSQFNVQSGATANFTAGQAPLLVPANAVLANNGTLSMNGNAITLDSGAILNVNSNFTTNGAIGKVGASAGYAINATAGVFTVNNAPTGFNTFAISGSSQVNLGVNLDISNATLTFGGTGALNQFTHSILSTAGALGGNATFTTTANFTPSGPITFLGANNTINVNGGTFAINTATYALTGFNNLNIGGGTFSLGSNFDIAGATVSLNSGTLALNGHTLSGTVGSALNLNANFSPALTDTINGITTINVNSGTTTLLTAPTGFTTLTVNALGILTLGGNFNFPNNGTLVDSGTFNMAGFTMTGAAGSAFSTTTNFSTNGAITNVPTINVNGGTFLVQNNNTITGFTNFNIAGPAVATINAGSNLQGTTITNSGTLNLAGGTFSAALNGNLGSNLNITAGTFTTAFPINGISNIHVQTAGTGFVMNNNVQGFTSFITDAGTTTTLSSGVLLGAPASAVTINNNGTLLVNGGTVNGPIVGTNTSILNLSSNTGNNPVLSNIVTGIPTINVFNNATVFTATTNISGFNAFNINAGTTTIVGPTASLTGAAGATITNDGTLNMNGGGLTGNIAGGIASALNVNANYATNGTITGINNIQVQNNNTEFTVNNAVEFNNMTVGAIPGSATVALNAGGSLTPANGGNITLNAGGVMNLNGGTINGNVVAGLGNASINVNGNFTLASGNSIGLANAPISSLVINSPGLLTVNGSLSILNTTINAGGTLSLNTPLTLPNGASINDSGVFLMNGNNILANPSSGTTLILNNDFNATGNISNLSTIIANSGNFSINVSPTGYGIFTIGNGATVILDTTLTVPSNATLSNAGTLNMNGNNISMGNASTLNISNTFSTNGTIALASDASGYNVSVGNTTFSVNNPVSGYSNLSVASGGIVNLNSGGSLLNSINLSGILNINGGTFSGNVTGGGIVNVNNVYTPNGVISVGNIIVTDGGVLTLNTPVSVANGAFVNPNGTLILNSNIFGALTNNGLVIQPAIATNTISGNYIQSGTLQVALSKGANSLLQVGGNAILEGGYIQVTLPHRGTRILNNDTFDVINSNGLMTVNTLPSVSFPTSAVLSFTPSYNSHNLVLTANRIPLSAINKIPTLKGISEELEIIRGSTSESKFDDLLYILDQQSTVAGVEKILLNLLPDEVNGGAFQSSMLSQNLVLNQIIHRADMLRAGVDQFKRTGYAAGDLSEGQMSYGPIVFGNSAKQQPLGGISGYASNTAGFGFIGDTPISPFVRIGAGLSYSNTLVKVGNSGGSTTTIANVQGTLYSSANYGPLFLDGMVSYGVNHYKGKRNIQLFGETASANYQSGQYGGRARAGFSIPMYTVEVAPLGYVQYTHLNRSRYQEKGAPGFNLAVESHQVVGTQFGMGFRVTEVSQSEEFLPELHVMFINDVRSPDLIVTSQFVDGGGAFVSQGPKPPKAGVNIGMSLTALMQEDFLLVGGYDYETKKGFNSHSASVKFKWLFF